METTVFDEQKIISGSYAFYLEELDVEPGSVISYYAEATDNNTRMRSERSTSEIHFIEVRTFNERFEQADGQSGEGAQPITSELVPIQKQIIRDTWKHIYSRPATATEDYRFAVKKTGEKQGNLKDKAQRVVDGLYLLCETVLSSRKS